MADKKRNRNDAGTAAEEQATAIAHATKTAKFCVDDSISVLDPQRPTRTT
jgi:hypothetical protein